LHNLFLDTLEWTQLAYSDKHAPQPRYAHCAMKFNSLLVVYGGCSDPLENHIFIFSPGKKLKGKKEREREKEKEREREREREREISLYLFLFV